MSRRQLDLFAPDREPELLDDDDYQPVVFKPNPDRVRARLHKILAEARAAETFPWTEHKTSLYRVIFPQMTGCLPEEEAAQLRFEFEAELARLEAA